MGSVEVFKYLREGIILEEQVILEEARNPF